MKALILAPHPDDPVFWCFSLLKPESKVIVFSDMDKTGISALLDEMQVPYQMHGVKDNHFPEYKPTLVHIIEQELQYGDFGEKYDTLVIPSRCHNQDHNAVWEAAKIAARQSARIPGMETWEYPYWTSFEYQFKPNRLKAVSKQLKQAAIARFPEVPQWIKYVSAYNQYLGAWNNCACWCEAFHVSL